MVTEAKGVSVRANRFLRRRAAALALVKLRQALRGHSLGGSLTWQEVRRIELRWIDTEEKGGRIAANEAEEARALVRANFPDSSAGGPDMTLKVWEVWAMERAR